MHRHINYIEIMILAVHRYSGRPEMNDSCRDDSQSCLAFSEEHSCMAFQSFIACIAWNDSI